MHRHRTARRAASPPWVMPMLIATSRGWRSQASHNVREGSVIGTKHTDGRDRCFGGPCAIFCAQGQAHHRWTTTSNPMTSNPMTSNPRASSAIPGCGCTRSPSSRTRRPSAASAKACSSFTPPRHSCSPSQCYTMHTIDTFTYTTRLFIVHV